MPSKLNKAIVSMYGFHLQEKNSRGLKYLLELFCIFFEIYIPINSKTKNTTIIINI